MGPETLRGLIDAYIAGDVVARKVIADWLEETDDPRAGPVRADGADWDELACRLAGVPARKGQFDLPQPAPRYRWLIDCARFGAGAPPEVEAAVRDARRAWLAGLFPELGLAEEEGR
jgi:hypothetical protein